MAGLYKFLSVVSLTLSIFHLMEASPVSLPQNVLELTENNFDSTANGENPLLVDFYAPWCPHCRDVMPQFEKAATQLKSELPQMTLGKVDCVKSKTLCTKYDVNFIPRIQLFYQGKALDKLSGDKTQETIIAFVKKAFQEATSALRKLQAKPNSAAHSIPAPESKKTE